MLDSAKNAHIMKINFPLLFIIALVIGLSMIAGHSRAAVKLGESYPMVCDAPWILQGLQQSIIKVNNLGPGLQFQFDHVQEYKPGSQQSQNGQLFCITYLKLVEAQSQRITDKVRLRYQVKLSSDKASAGAAYSIEFEPLR